MHINLKKRKEKKNTTTQDRQQLIDNEEGGVPEGCQSFARRQITAFVWIKSRKHPVRLRLGIVSLQVFIMASAPIEHSGSPSLPSRCFLPNDSGTLAPSGLLQQWHGGAKASEALPEIAPK